MKKNGTIVLIDDNKAELKLAEVAMKQAGKRNACISFDGSLPAFEYITGHAKEIFLVISDLKMPGMTGLELLEKLNSDVKLKMWTIPFIIISNSGNEKDVEHAYTIAVQGYFIKPMNIDQLKIIFSDIITYWNDAEIPRD